MDTVKKTALITGASQGIGAEFARLFAKDGYNLILIARQLDKLNEIKSSLETEYKIKVTVLQKDMCRFSAPQEIFDFTKSLNCKIDTLVNNAGFGDWGFFAQSDLKKQQEMIQLNITALTTLTYLFLPQMIESNSGKILNTASVASFMPGAKMAVYYASKAFVRSFSEALAVELKKTGSHVSVTALCPGPVKTDFWNRAEAQKSSLSRFLLFADCKKVAKYGYKKMMRGKVLALPCLSVQFFAFLTKILPRSWTRKLVYFVQK